MKLGRNRLIFGLIGGAAFVAWALAAHITSQQSEAAPWAVALAALPLLLIAFGAVRGLTRSLLPPLAALAACGTLLYLAWPFLQQNVHSMYLAQHVGMNGALGLLFGRSLFGGREPLVTHFASLIRTDMAPAVRRYTRQATVAWTIFFATMTATSLLLYFLAPIEAWSLLANVLTLPLVGLMFLGEALVRHAVLPPEECLGIRETIRAYRLAMAKRHAAGSPHSS